MLDGERGSGDKRRTASSRVGGDGVDWTMMLRACSAAVRVCCSLSREAVDWARAFSIAVRAVERVWILVMRVGKAVLEGSRVCPRVLASRASVSLSRARRAAEDR